MHGTPHGNKDWYHRNDNKRRTTMPSAKHISDKVHYFRQINESRRQEIAAAKARREAEAMAAKARREADAMAVQHQWDKENQAEKDYTAKFKNEHWSDPDWAEEMEDQSDAMRKAAQLRPQLYVPCT